jgi:(p)ppGpp synthase/HD superfamily hydrolase
MPLLQRLTKTTNASLASPTLMHLVETAKSLAELGMGAKTIAAGLLHDSIEDVGVKPETIEKEFGKEVLFLIEGVTKLGHLKYHGTERHRESCANCLSQPAKMCACSSSS